MLGSSLHNTRRTERIRSGWSSVKRDGVERCVEFQKVKLDRAMVLLDEAGQCPVRGCGTGVDVKCIELCFLAVDFKKSLHVALYSATQSAGRDRKWSAGSFRV